MFCPQLKDWAPFFCSLFHPSDFQKHPFSFLRKSLLTTSEAQAGPLKAHILSTAHSCFTAPLPHLSVSPIKPHTSCKNTRVTSPSTQQTFSQHSDIRNVQPDAPPVTQAKSSDVFTNSVVSAYHPASVQSQAYFICTELFFRAYVLHFKFTDL